MGTTFLLVMIVVVLAGASLGVTASLSPRGRAAWVYGQLAVMTGIYVGFALAGIDPQGVVLKASLSALVVEGMTGLLFLLVGLAVLQSDRPWLLGVLVLAHGGVELLHCRERRHLENVVHSARDVARCIGQCRSVGLPERWPLRGAQLLQSSLLNGGERAAEIGGWGGDGGRLGGPRSGWGGGRH